MSSSPPVVPEPFGPPGLQWSAVSPRLVVVRRVSGLIAVIPPVLLAAGAGFWWAPLWWALVPLLLVAGWWWWLVGRQVPAIGYAERDDDLLVRGGILVRHLVVVPYGRLQYVDVRAGPLDRAFGIARVQLHTASAATDAAIPGLPPDAAARLRETLAARGRANLAGL